MGEHVGGAIVEQIDRSVRLKIHRQRAVAALLTTQGNIVNTQHARATLETVILERMQDPQERIRADRHSDLPREASATFAASLQGKAREQLSGAVRPTSVPSQSTIEALGEYGLG